MNGDFVLEFIPLILILASLFCLYKANHYGNKAKRLLKELDEIIKKRDELKYLRITV
jgi:hypothetical protein